jgi:hypothetical protein
MKFRLFRKNKKPKETVDVEIQFTAICSRYESQLRSLVSEWEGLTEKWDAKAATIAETVKNETNQSWLEKFSNDPQSQMKAEFMRVSMYVVRIKKSIRREFKLLRKAYDKQNARILKTRINSWLDELIGSSDLSINPAFLTFKIEFRSRRYGSKLNKQRELKKSASRAESQRIRTEQIARERERQVREEERLVQLRRQEDQKYKCLKCGSYPSAREAAANFAKNYYKHQKMVLKGEQIQRSGEESLASALKWKRRFGEAALVEMNLRQKEVRQYHAPDICSECGVDWTPLNFPIR